MSTPKFKVGDRVRFIDKDGEGHYNAINGRAYTVIGVTDLGRSQELVQAEDEYKNHISVYPKRLELISPESELEEPQRNVDAVKSGSSEDELAELVRKANEGYKALNQIANKYPDKTAIYLDSREYSGVPDDYKREVYKVRIKPKPTFTPFTVGDGWKVKLRGDMLRIGCRDFDAGEFKSVLSSLCKSRKAYAFLSNGKLTSTRLGIRDVAENEISWNDADRILKALEAAGV